MSTSLKVINLFINKRKKSKKEKPTNQIIANFRKTGKYFRTFLRDLKEGLVDYKKFSSAEEMFKKLGI